jgi:hypothetical protein
MIKFAWLFLPLIACQPSDDGGFGGGGSNNTPTDGNNDTSDGNSDLPDGWPAPQDTNGPSLRNFIVIHDTYPNIGDVLEANVEFWDAQSNVEGGGEINLILNGGDWSNATAKAIIGGTDGTAWVDGEKIWFVVGNVWDWESYVIDLMVTDKQGNRSNVVQANADP